MTAADRPMTSAHRLSWMSPGAPYMPVASIGLLGVLAEADPLAALAWIDQDDPYTPPALTLTTTLSMDEVAEAVVAAPWPKLDNLEWRTPPGQAIKPTLQKLTDAGDREIAAVSEWRSLAGLSSSASAEQASDPRHSAAQKLIAALLTDGALDDKGLPGRSRLLRGVKADLSGVAKPPKTEAAEIVGELANGPTWTSGSSGLGLGLVPEVQTFGGTTGPTPSAVGAYSKLLYRLCWQGIMAMPPFGVRGVSRTIVGGPLFASADTLSWPVWSMPLRRSALIALFGLEPVHASEPNRDLLRAHGVLAVFRSRAREINTMLSVFGRGDRIA